jgi:hypothetical protein
LSFIGNVLVDLAAGTAGTVLADSALVWYRLTNDLTASTYLTTFSWQVV